MNTAKIIVLAGQSNEVGVAHTKYLPRHFSSEKVEKCKAGYLFVENIKNEKL